ncbi:MAG: ABC transporter substrate-binding protein [Thermostichus sp. HHBFW_bins_43]
MKPGFSTGIPQGLMAGMTWAVVSVGMGSPLMVGSLGSLAQAQSQTLDQVTFGTSWYAQAEHGGFYQAVATGIYEKYGLDVTIQMGGPNVNNVQLLMGDVLDLMMAPNNLTVLRPLEEDVPIMAVAAIFQKNPQVIIAHPDVESLADLKGRPIYISASAAMGYWPFLESRFGFTEDQKRPYNFSVSPFIVDPTSAQQGFLTSEPLAVEREGGFTPSVFLLADAGWAPYGSLIATKRDTVESNPDLVQRFVNASIEGWYSFFKDPQPAFELIKIDNPDMSDEQLAYSFQKLQEYGIIDSGDTATLGIGAMTDERWETFFKEMVEAGVLQAETDFQQAYTLDFVNQRVGMD